MLPQTSRPHQAQGKNFAVCPPLLKPYLPLGWLEPVPGGSKPNPHVQVSYIVVSPPSKGPTAASPVGAVRLLQLLHSAALRLLLCQARPTGWHCLLRNGQPGRRSWQA